MYKKYDNVLLKWGDYVGQKGKLFQLKVDVDIELQSAKVTTYEATEDKEAMDDEFFWKQMTTTITMQKEMTLKVLLYNRSIDDRRG
jgi:hypothetical protein